MKSFRDSLSNNRKLIDIVSLSELMEEESFEKGYLMNRGLSEMLSKNDEVRYMIYDNMHEFIVEICNEKRLLKYCNSIASLCNEYTGRNYGYVFPENVTDNNYAIKLIKSGKITCYKYQYATNLFIIKYLGNEVFAIYDI